MDHEKIAVTLKCLRLQKNMTQRQVAQRLGITEQAVSKWERCLGLPDIGLCPELAEVYGVSIEVILTGCLEENQEVGTNMKKLNYYICPVCGNVVVSAAKADIHCCGRPLEPVVLQKAAEDEKMKVESIDGERYITCGHPMTKENFISFTAFATGEKLEVVRHYPEWDFQLRLPGRGHGMLLWYSAAEGLKYQLL